MGMFIACAAEYSHHVIWLRTFTIVFLKSWDRSTCTYHEVQLPPIGRLSYLVCLNVYWAPMGLIGNVHLW